ncbi:MAG: glycosyltransferase family 4 protein [Magnetococcales bacterium]|nr:glycosyltransferase family 4 protein [Magnetococcales bacterium]
MTLSKTRRTRSAADPALPPDHGLWRLLAIVPTDLDALREKGVADQLLERDAGGLFGQVITVHPRAARQRVVWLTAHHQVREFSIRAFPGVEAVPLLRYVWDPIQLLWLAWTLARLVRRERIDLIRSQDPFWCGLLGWIASRSNGCVPFCVSLHADYGKRHELDGGRGAPTLFRSRRLTRWLESWVLSRADRVLPIRVSLGDYARASGAPAQRLRVIPHGIDLSLFRGPLPVADPWSALDLPRERKILGFVGRLSRENYVDDLLETVRRLAPRRRDFVLVLMGGGTEEERLRRQVAADPLLRNHVILTGFQPHVLAVALRRISTVGLCLMGGFSLIEACAAGRPVIAYAVEWHRELVRNDASGFLLPEGDVAGVAAAVERLLDDPELAHRLGTGARDLAWAAHDVDTARERLVAVYRELLGLADESSGPVDP